jgi:hypothetical protein
MDVSSVGSGAFEFYDGLRILIPGTFIVALYVAIGDTFGFVSGVGDVKALPAIAGALLTGILLLFLDLPSSAAVFQYESPLNVMRAWVVSPPKGSYLLNVYYEILDSEFPGTIRTRVHYLGVIYRIGFESVYLLAVPAIATLTIGTIYPGIGVQRHASVERGHLTIVVAGVVLFATFVGSVVSRWRGRSRSSKYTADTRWEKARDIFAELLRELPRPDRWCLAIGAGSVALYVAEDWRPLGAAGVVITTSVWALRYHLGFKRPEVTGQTRKVLDPVTGTVLPSRQNPHVQTGMFLSTAAAAATLVCAYHGLATNGPLGNRALVDWLGALIAAFLLLVSRSHERKLLGSYAEQRTWLLRNKAKMIENGYFGPTKADQEPLDQVD